MTATTLLEGPLARIGATPMVALRRVPPAGTRILLKLEDANPTGSMKDRMALAMVEAAEADGRLRMPAVGSGYFGRLLVDPRHPAAAAAIAAEAQAAVRAGYRIVFDDNANMANADTYQGLVDPTRTLTDADVWAMYAAAITIQRTEFVRMGASVEICVNVGAPWRHPDCAGFWWDLGVRAVMLEQPDKRGPGDPTWGAWQQFGTAWLNKGGTLYIILANEQVGAGLAAALDSERTFVTR